MTRTVRAIETSSLHLDIISDMRRINSFFCSTAYPILERAGQLRRSRLRSGATVTQSAPVRDPLLPDPPADPLSEPLPDPLRGESGEGAQARP